MSILDAGHGRSALPSHRAMFGLHSVLGLSNKTEPQQDSNGSCESSATEISKASQLTSRSSKSLFRLSTSKLSFDPLSRAAITTQLCLMQLFAISLLITHAVSYPSTCLPAILQALQVTQCMYMSTALMQQVTLQAVTCFKAIQALQAL